MEIDLSYKDLDLEGVLDMEEYCKDNNIAVEEVTYLECDEIGLTELKGLNKLINLEVLNCRHNYLRELDVSKLVNLKNLDCGSNKLIELDVSKLVNLKKLYCENNKLTKLDLSRLFNLKEVYCYINNITELKGFEKLVNLEYLYCSNNKLIELDLSKLVNLQWLNGEEYIQPEVKPEPDKFDLILSKIEKLEKDIAEIKTKI